MNAIMNPIVIKIGGSTLGSHDTTLEDLVALQKEGKQVVVVHGGGALITDWLGKQGVASRFVRGLRVTDKPTLQVVTAVLAGLVNKELVAQIHALGGNAWGLSGADGCLIAGRVKDPELGFVGEIEKINLKPLKSVLREGYIPVIAPVALEPEKGTLLNINADTAAAEIAAALKAQKLIFLTDVPGVLDKSGKLIPRLSPPEARNLIASGVAGGGMIPKLEACLAALRRVPQAQIIDGRIAHALLQETSGTTIA